MHVVLDKDVLAAMGMAARYLKLTLEPGGAVALAAALRYGGEGNGPLGLILSGGNVDPAMLARALV